MASGCSAAAETGISLEGAGEARRLTGRAEINRRLRAVGAQVWPLALGDGPSDVRTLLERASLSESEQARLVEQFLLPPHFSP